MTNLPNDVDHPPRPTHSPICLRFSLEIVAQSSVSVALPAIGEDLAVAEELDRLDQTRLSKHTLWDTEVSIARRTSRHVKPKALNVQHDRDAADQPVASGSSGGAHRVGDNCDRHETPIHRR